jgi:pyridoxamine 5'-phosphate oxidase
MHSTDPFALFAAWMDEAAATERAPSARIVLLKGLDPAQADPRGFVFYTNTLSRKGGELAANPRAALLFHWKTLGRQVRVEGPASPVSAAEADAYYASRARISRLGAWASLQSQPLPDRATLERRVEEYGALHPGDDVPRPPHWSGWRVVPETIEFWRDMPFRLHDRNVYTRDGAGWTTGKLYP